MSKKIFSIVGILGFMAFGVINAKGATVESLITTLAVNDKVPAQEQEKFNTSAGKIYAFAKLNVETPQSIKVQWYRDNHLYHTQELSIKASPRFRVWSYITAHPGHWKVTIVDASDHELSSKAFEVSSDHHSSDNNHVTPTTDAPEEEKDEGKEKDSDHVSPSSQDKKEKQPASINTVSDADDAAEEPGD